MATRIPKYTVRPGKKTSTPPAPEPCAPPCPACGGLKCLCRPRFFAGQLLTEQDLNRLDTYIREKNRLHNRYVHGWGVVCGLEVTCHDCENLVKVSSGYALSPCGDDVVVCEDATVDVCSLIRRCDREARRPECEPPRPRDPGCEDIEETWVLSVCYDEKPSRGITALRAEGCACSRCSGGGGGGCGCGGSGGHAHSAGNGCGCNGNGNGKTQATTSRTGTSAVPAQCEPTVVCEGHRFQVYRAPEPDLEEDERGGVRGPLVERIMACVQPYLAWIKGVSSGGGDDQTQTQRNRFCCTAKARLRAVLLASPRHNCELLADLDAIVCPSPDLPAESFNAAMDEVGQRVVVIWFQGLMACICSGLLPPCPEPADDNCIPLATVTVRKRDCRILRVCNWTVHRKFATTVPALQYWLGVLPYGRYLREVMEEVCCGMLDIEWPNRDPQNPPPPPPPPPPTAPGAASATGADADFAPRSADAGGQGGGAEYVRSGGKGFGGLGGAMPFHSAYPRQISTLLAAAVTGRSTPLDPQTLARGLGGAKGMEGKSGRVLRDHERANLPQYILASQLAQPLLSALVPDDLSDLIPAASSLRSRAGGGGGNEELESLRREVAEMKAALEEQRRTIEQMNQRPGG
ncbi:MAG TPA: hypothetical protein VHG28_21375 [Longimicrobiaceae bacterium]|nr:hypothetical protein [Longimicrobiaceae bacterium]